MKDTGKWNIPDPISLMGVLLLFLQSTMKTLFECEYLTPVMKMSH